MCSVATNIKQIIMATAVCGLMISCSSSDKDKAENLYAQAEESVTMGDYKLALSMLDSIDHTYPGEVEVRREGMHLRPLVIEKITLTELSQTDSLLAVCRLKNDSIGNYISKVDNPIEPYFVSKEFKGVDPVSAPGLYARITPDGQFYVLSSINKSLNSRSVAITLPNGVSAQSAVVPYDGERNDKQGGAEIITFMQSECDTIGALASNNADGKFTLSFNGDKQYSMPLPDGQLKAIATMYEAASLFRDMKVLQIRKTHLEKKLELSRSQQARTFDDKSRDNE